jgi:hypothetical protein
MLMHTVGTMLLLADAVCAGVAVKKIWNFDLDAAVKMLVVGGIALLAAGA